MLESFARQADNAFYSKPKKQCRLFWSFDGSVQAFCVRLREGSRTAGCVEGWANHARGGEASDSRPVDRPAV